MKKHFKILFDILLFGIPLFIRVLVKVKEYQKIIDDQVHVTLITYFNGDFPQDDVSLIELRSIKLNGATGKKILTLRVDDYKSMPI